MVVKLVAASVVVAAAVHAHDRVVAFGHQTDFVARQAEYSVNSGATTDIIVFETKTVGLGDKADPAHYAFNAPEGSRELTAAELNADQWYTDLDKALEAAKASNKMVFAFFSADW